MANEAVSSAPKDADVDDVDVDEVDAVDEADDDDKDDAEAKKLLGDKGKQALDRTKEKWRTERDRAKALEAELAKLKAPKPDDKAEEKPDLDAIRKAAREEVAAESLKERALDKLEAKAARLFADPEDARTFLANQADDFITNGKVDVDAINEALAELLEKRPYLGVTQGDAKRFKGTGDGGKKGDPAGKPQLSEADVKRMYREGKHEEIEKARVDGRLNDLLGIKPS